MKIIDVIIKKTTEAYKHLDAIEMLNKNRKYWKQVILAKSNNVAFAIKEWEFHYNRLIKLKKEE